MVAQNGKLIMGTQSAHILRVDLQHPRDLEDIPDLGKRETDKIHAVYQDPTGAHVLISMVAGDNYYLHESKKKPQLVKAMNGIVVSSVVRFVAPAQLYPRDSSSCHLCRRGM